MNKNESKTIIRIAAMLGATAVAIGAFGAHGLKPLLNEYQQNIFEKGVQYQFFHVAALLATGLLLRDQPTSRTLWRAAWLFIAGIFCFSGSLYLLACRDLIAVPVGLLGPVTPIGGLCFIAGWLLLFGSLNKA